MSLERNKLLLNLVLTVKTYVPLLLWRFVSIEITILASMLFPIEQQICIQSREKFCSFAVESNKLLKNSLYSDLNGNLDEGCKSLLALNVLILIT
jgi:hypothetical protein